MTEQVNENPYRIKLDKKAFDLVERELLQALHSLVHTTDKDYLTYYQGLVRAHSTILPNCGYEIEFKLELKPIE